jgi:beta-aspartyl-peptidase (threonine type)
VAGLALAGLLTSPLAIAADPPPIAIVIHGGAGVINRSDMTPSRELQYKAGLEAARDAGYAVLERGGSALDAVTAAVHSMEDDPLFNAGKGAVLNHLGIAELDSSIMDGKTLRAGAVAGVQHVKNPVELARAVMEKSPHVMIAGAGAEEFALEQGLTMVPNSYFRTEPRVRALEKALRANPTTALDANPADPPLAGAALNPNPALNDAPLNANPNTASPGATRPVANLIPRSDPFDDAKGTVGAVALDRNGNLAAATSTGGMTNKRPGRIGDSPLIGAGTYANNASCAVSATGDGEFFIRAVVAHDICALVEYKRLPLDAAAREVIHTKIEGMHATGGVIALDTSGHIVMDFNSEGMFRASRDSLGRRDVAIYGNR